MKSLLRPKSRYPIRYKLILTFLLMVISTSLVIGGVALHNFKKSIEAEVSDHLLSVANLQKQRIETFLKHSRERMELVASRTQLRLSLKKHLTNPQDEHIQKMRRILIDAKNSIPDFKSISITTMDNYVIVSTDLDKIGRREMKDDLHSDIGITLDNSEQNKHSNPAQMLNLHLHHPLVLDGETLGLVMVDATASELFRITGDYTGLGESGETILAERLPNGDARFLTPLRFDLDATMKRTIPAHRNDMPIIRALNGNLGLHRDIVDYREVPVFAITTVIHEADWGLLIKIDQSEVSKSYQALRADMLLSILAFLTIGIIGAFFLSRSISRPIEHLTDAAKKVKAGKEAFEISHDTISDEETAVLANAFDEMTSELFHSIKKIEAANNAKSEFLASMSHDLRTPLNAIMGFSDMMRQKAFGPLGNEHYEEYVEDIHNSGSLLVSLINDILDLSKIEAGKYELINEPVSITSIVDVCIRQLTTLASISNLTLTSDTPDDLPHINGDERAIIQVLNNLMSNSIKFTQDGGMVVVRGYLNDQNGISISVKDTGIGMSPEGVSKALKPFEQADGTHSRRHEGTGLGLHLCANLMKLFGGTLHIESEPNTGTTVSIHFPPERTIEPSS
ncbi:ATP-binding protein [Magnetovibrio sp. PR-2]|uniref:sensor histidine kinase n=1 Tax=Magnetovibrio sp. PR-2 TaxID=3120356 RepID=UPI002FCE09CB